MDSSSRARCLPSAATSRSMSSSGSCTSSCALRTQHRPRALRRAQPRDRGAVGANDGLATGQPQVVPVDLRVGAVPRDPRLVESAQSELVGDVEVVVGAAHQPHEVAAAVARQHRVPRLEQPAAEAEGRPRGGARGLIVETGVLDVDPAGRAAIAVEQRPAERGRVHPRPLPPVDLAVGEHERGRLPVGQHPMLGDRRREADHGSSGAKRGNSSRWQNSRKPCWSGPTWWR